MNDRPFNNDVPRWWAAGSPPNLNQPVSHSDSASRHHAARDRAQTLAEILTNLRLEAEIAHEIRVRLRWIEALDNAGRTTAGGLRPASVLLTVTLACSAANLLLAGCLAFHPHEIGSLALSSALVLFVCGLSGQFVLGRKPLAVRDRWVDRLGVAGAIMVITFVVLLSLRLAGPKDPNHVLSFLVADRCWLLMALVLAELAGSVLLAIRQQEQCVPRDRNVLLAELADLEDERAAVEADLAQLFGHLAELDTPRVCSPRPY